jgi:hypothetical protein
MTTGIIQPGKLALDGADGRASATRSSVAADVAAAESIRTEVLDELRERDGGVSVADVGLLDEDGCSCISDWRTNVELRRGKNLDKRGIDGTLGAQSGVRSAIAIGLPDVGLGERAQETVEVDAAVTKNGLRAHQRERLVEYQRPARGGLLAVYLRMIPAEQGCRA